MPNTFIAGIIAFIICIFVSDTQRNRKNVCIFVCICFILQAGMRDYLHATNDTYNYVRMYREVLPWTLDEALNLFREWGNHYENRDPGYTVFVKLTQLIYPDFRVFLLMVASIISIPICKIIYNFCNSLSGIAVSVIIYEALFAGFFETGIRQTIAMGIIYFSVPYILKRNWKKHYLLLVIAYTFHSSALIFAPFYFLVNMKFTKKLLVWCIVLTPVFMAIAPQLIVFLGEGTNFEHYANTKVDNLGTPVFSALLFIVAIGTYFLRNSFDENNIKDRLLLSSIVCSLVLMPSTWVNSNFIRLVFYYLIFMMPLIPRLVDYVSKDNPNVRGLVSFMIITVLVFLTWH